MNDLKFIIGLLVFLWSCNGTTSNQFHKDDISSISVVDGKYQVDNNIILSRQNLRPLISHLEESTLKDYKIAQAIPNFITSFLENITGDNFKMANPHEEWQAGCVAPMEIEHFDKRDSSSTIIFKEKGIPSKQLSYFGLGKDIALLSYYEGGYSVTESILILKFTENKITDFWFGGGLVGLTSKEELINEIKRY